MLRSPIFRYFYLPWAAGICLMIGVLLQPTSDLQPEDELYRAELAPIVISPDAPVRLIRISPRFPGCEDAPDRDQCSEQRLEDYLYGSTAYPASPDNVGTAGLAMVQLRITARGKMTDINLMRDPGYGRGKDALDIIRKIQSEHIRWTPATINGTPIDFEVFLKIRYSNFYWAR